MSNRLSRLEARAQQVQAALEEEKAIDLAIAQFCCNTNSRQIVDRPDPDGNCPDGWKPCESGLCESPPQAAYDLAQGCWVMGVQVRWDAELGQWRGDAYWDDDLNLWLVK